MEKLVERLEKLNVVKKENAPENASGDLIYFGGSIYDIAETYEELSKIKNDKTGIIEETKDKLIDNLELVLGDYAAIENADLLDYEKDVDELFERKEDIREVFGVNIINR